MPYLTTEHALSIMGGDNPARYFIGECTCRPVQAANGGEVYVGLLYLCPVHGPGNPDRYFLGDCTCRAKKSSVGLHTDAPVISCLGQEQCPAHRERGGGEPWELLLAVPDGIICNLGRLNQVEPVKRRDYIATLSRCSPNELQIMARCPYTGVQPCAACSGSCPICPDREEAPEE